MARAFVTLGHETRPSLPDRPTRRYPGGTASLADWQRLMNRLNKYEQAFKRKADLEEALGQVRQLRKSGQPKQTLTEFLDEL